MDHFDSQAFAPALSYKHCFELAALDTLQHRLPRDAEFEGGLEHRQILRRGLRHDARPQLSGDSNLPRSACSDLLTRDETIRQPAMNAGRIHS